MTTFLSIKSRVADDLDRTDLTTQIDRELRNAVKHYENERFWFQETTGNITTSASLAYYSPPTDLLIFDRLEITIGTNRLELNEIGWDRYVQDYAPMTTTNQPDSWVYYADQIWLGSAPSDAWVMTLSYVKTLGPASFTDGTENAWTNYAEDLISARALKTIGARVLGLAPPQLLTFQALENQAHSALCGLNEQKLMTGRARPWM